MAKGFTSTINLRCWKEHTCSACNTVYSYLLARKVVGRGRTPDKASASAQALAFKTSKTQTDMQPCPNCGLYQADMIGQRRAKSRMQILVIAVIAIAAILITRAAYGMQASTLAWAAFVTCLLAAAAHFALEILNYNRDLDANLFVAQQRIEKGVLRLGEGAAAPVPADIANPARPIVHKAALALLAISPFLAAAPEFARMSHKWPLNSECYPPVVGPTDSTRIYLPRVISSVKGYWRGTVTVAFHFPGAPAEGLPAQADTNENKWDSTIEDVKEEEKSSDSHPWVHVTLPDSLALAGQAVNCDIHMQLEYPVIQPGGTTYRTADETTQYSLIINTAPSGAGSKYDSLWWMGVAGGGACVIVASLLLYSQARAFQRQAKPARVLTA